MTELEHNRIAELKAELFIKTEECNEIIRRCQDAEAQSARDMEVVVELIEVLNPFADEWPNLEIIMNIELQNKPPFTATELSIRESKFLQFKKASHAISKAKAHFGKRLRGRE